MVIQALRKTTLLQALSQAGGIADDAGSTVIVTRPAADVSESADRMIIGAIGSSDLYDQFVRRSGIRRFAFQYSLVGGDVVSVPRAGIIYVVGAVNHRAVSSCKTIWTT